MPNKLATICLLELLVGPGETQAAIAAPQPIAIDVQS
jgi:hypothetical protein